MLQMRKILCCVYNLLCYHKHPRLKNVICITNNLGVWMANLVCWSKYNNYKVLKKNLTKARCLDRSFNSNFVFNNIVYNSRAESNIIIIIVRKASHPFKICSDFLRPPYPSWKKEQPDFSRFSSFQSSLSVAKGDRKLPIHKYGSL